MNTTPPTRLADLGSKCVPVEVERHPLVTDPLRPGAELDMIRTAIRPPTLPRRERRQQIDAAHSFRPIARSRQRIVDVVPQSGISGAG